MLEDFTSTKLRQLRQQSSVLKMHAKAEFRASNIRKAYYYMRKAQMKDRKAYMLLWNSTEGFLN